MKYCGKCGSQLNENGLCPRCDAAQIEKMNEPIQTYTASNSSDVQPPAKKKKSGKKAVKVIAVVLAVVIVLGAAAGVLSYFNVVDIPVISPLVASITGQADTSQKSFIINHDGNEYYLGGACAVKLNDDGSITPVRCIDADEEISGDETELTNESSSVLYFAGDQVVYDGNTLYTRYDNNYKKYTFIDDNTVEESVWISEKTLKKSDVVKLLDTQSDTAHVYLYDLKLDGDYVYFYYYPDQGYFNSQKKIAYRLGRISKDGSSVEFIGNERASSYTVNNGWIYYYDNGYTYDEGYEDKYYIDYDRAGIYKMKVDGSGKKKLLDDVERNDTVIYCNELCKKLEVFDNYLYFLDCTDGNMDRVGRIKTNGSEIEHVSDEGAYCYTVDTDNNELYYINAEYAQSSIDSRTMYKVDLNDMKEEYVCEYGHYGGPEIDYYDGHLYFSNSMYYISGLSGMRYNINTGEREEMHGDYEYEEIKEGIITKKISHGPYLNWETVED